MDIGLASAGIISLLLAFGHATIGLRFVLVGIAGGLPSTRLGSASMTEGMIRVTWHVVTIFALASAGVLFTLAWFEDADPRVVVLRWFAVMWIAATAMAFFVVRPPRRLMRLPVPLLWVVVAILCWLASI